MNPRTLFKTDFPNMLQNFNLTSRPPQIKRSPSTDIIRRIFTFFTIDILYQLRNILFGRSLFRKWEAPLSALIETFVTSCLSIKQKIIIKIVIIIIMVIIKLSTTTTFCHHQLPPCSLLPFYIIALIFVTF
jgi:hypothetical protein